MNEKWRKFFAFEWLVFLLAGLFWAAAMFLPLFLSRSFDHKENLWRNFLVMWGPYTIYFVARLCFLLYRSLIWAYLVSNLFFRSESERRLADEWIMAVLLVLYWGILVIVPLYLYGMFSPSSWPLACVVLLGPYLLSVVCRFLYRSVFWAIESQK